jgi:hypothetical protein
MVFTEPPSSDWRNSKDCSIGSFGQEYCCWTESGVEYCQTCVRIPYDDLNPDGGLGMHTKRKTVPRTAANTSAIWSYCPSARRCFRATRRATNTPDSTNRRWKHIAKRWPLFILFCTALPTPNELLAQIPLAPVSIDHQSPSSTSSFPDTKKSPSHLALTLIPFLTDKTQLQMKARLTKERELLKTRNLILRIISRRHNKSGQ